MYTIDSGPFTLACHPQTPSQAICEIDVTVRAANNGSLMLSFCLPGDIPALTIPESGSPRRADDLWRHTCFEAFVMAGEGPEYREFNFSPSGEWAVYTFSGYRNARIQESGLQDELSPELYPAIKVHRTTDRLELAAEICQGLLPPGRPLRLGLSAIVEDAGGILSYWALRHPPGKPDFHHPDAFTLQLEKT
jgi:hypothetical protein